MTSIEVGSAVPQMAVEESAYPAFFSVDTEMTFLVTPACIGTALVGGFVTTASRTDAMGEENCVSLNADWDAPTDRNRWSNRMECRDRSDPCDRASAPDAFDRQIALPHLPRLAAFHEFWDVGARMSHPSS